MADYSVWFTDEGENKADDVSADSPLKAAEIGAVKGYEGLGEETVQVFVRHKEDRSCYQFEVYIALAGKATEIVYGGEPSANTFIFGDGDD